MQLPGADPDGALARALGKLAGVLGDDGVVVDVPQPPATVDLAAAVNDNARLRVRYWSANRDESTEREITPRSIFLDRGHWYVIADDSRSGESRTFRIDRFEEWERTGAIDVPTQGSSPAMPPSGDQWFVDSDVPSVVLRLAPQARWAAERYPLRDERQESDTSAAIVVRMAVANEQWLRTLLLRLGPHAAVLEPAEWHDLGADAARQLVARYDTTDS
jgi:proteasome accessory factor C